MRGHALVSRSDFENGSVLPVEGTSFRPFGLAAALTTIAALSGVILRWFELGKLSLWWDEGFTAWQSGLPLHEIVRFARSDTYPPLYFFLQHFWVILFGNSEFALRALSAFFGTLSLLVFFLLAKKVLKDSLAVVLSVWLFAFSMMQIWYSREARSYELASFLALVSLYALVLFLEKRSPLVFACIVLAVAASLYMHNMMFFYLFALNITWLIYPSQRSWRVRLAELFLADVLAGVLFLPWAFSLLTQVSTVGGHLWWVPRPTISNLLQTMSLIAGINLEYLSWLATRFFHVSAPAASVCVAVGAGLLCTAVVGSGVAYMSKGDKERTVALLSYCFIPLLLVFLLSQKMQPLYIERVFTASSAVVPLVFAYPLSVARPPGGRALQGFLGMVLAMTMVASAFGFLRYQEKEDWRAATNTLLRIPDTGRLIVFVPPAGEILFNYYSQRSQDKSLALAKMGLPANFTIPAPPARITGPTDIEPLKLTLGSGKYSEVDVILAHEVDPQSLVLNYLDSAYIRQEEKRFPGFKLIRFGASPNHVFVR